jgi:hypothetical protein
MQRPGLARERSLIGHNEDGAPENVGQCALLSLALDGLPSVTAFWYPVFLPANAFVVTADGLVWTIDHLPGCLAGRRGSPPFRRQPGRAAGHDPAPRPGRRPPATLIPDRAAGPPSRSSRRSSRISSSYLGRGEASRE